MPQEIAVLDYNEEFSAEEFERISCGLTPQAMEDKWLIYLEGNTLHLHRSWTGFCIYQVEFTAAEGKYLVCRALVNRDPTQHRAADNFYDAAVLRFLISKLLLGRQVAFPIPGARAKNRSKGLFQHHLTGTAWPEKLAETEQQPNHPAVRRPWWKFWQLC